MKNDGITLIELLVVITIIGILAVALGFSFQGWIGGYRIESQVKEMYVDLMNARARAMQRNRLHFVTLAATQYSTYEDTNPAPDGNETLETAVGGDTRLVQRNTDYTIIPALAFGATTFNFNRSGLISLSGSIRLDSLDSTVTPDYDCIVLSPTRINMGKWEECDAGNPGNECCAR